MSQTSREIVGRALKFENPDRLPRQIWRLPWAAKHVPEAMAEIDRRWPSDISGPSKVYQDSARYKGDPYLVGEHVDDWGCVFENIHEGVHGEVKSPILQDVKDWKKVVKPPFEILPENISTARDTVNRCCETSSSFMMAGCCPRPWERYQFIRGTEDAMMDMMDPDADVKGLLRMIHEFFLKELEFWCSTKVDSVMFMDDWGSQRQLLLPPAVWRELYKPLYKEYCDLARASGKFIFMHSDGYIAEIFDDLIEIGVSALNSQLFCMDIADLGRRGKGKIAFWGEIDRQHVLPSKNPDDGRQAVRIVAENLFDRRGGVFVQFEASPGCNPETMIAVMEEWDAVQREAGMKP
ncbi:MAG: uroporphyrinogen decarboxylase family protein [Victivallales bacterium]